MSSIPGYVPLIGETDLNKIIRAVRNLYENAAASADVPSGLISPYAGSSSPTGWLLCDGGAVSRTTYSDLFAAVGTTYGIGDGSTTFNVPDIKGRVVAGKESSATRLTSASGGVDGGTLGATGGAQAITLDTTQIPAHSHTATVTDPTHTHTTTSATGGSTGETAAALAAAQQRAATGASATGVTVSNANTGGGLGHANVQPTIVLNYIIKT